MDFVNILKKSNLKVTPQRLEIAKVIFENGHINIDDLFKILKERFPTLSLGTLYKNISSFLEKGIAQAVFIPNNKVKYELILEPHSHFICKSCGKVTDIQIDEVALKNLIAKNINNFDSFSFSVFGECCN